MFDREELAGEIAELRRTDGGADLPATLAEIERVIDRAARREPRLQRRRVCFFTDLGRTTWGDVSATRNAGDSAPTGGQSGTAGGRCGTARRTERGGDARGGGRWCRDRRPSDTHRHGSRELRQPGSHAAHRGSAGRRTADRAKNNWIFPREVAARAAVVHAFPIPGRARGGSALRRGSAGSGQSPLAQPGGPSRAGSAVRGRQVGRGQERGVRAGTGHVSRRRACGRPCNRKSRCWRKICSRYDCIFLCNVGRFGRDEAQPAAQVPRAGRRRRHVPGRSGAGRELQQHPGSRSG